MGSLPGLPHPKAQDRKARPSGPLSHGQGLVAALQEDQTGPSRSQS